jgi:hypothetical protein
MVLMVLPEVAVLGDAGRFRRAAGEGIVFRIVEDDASSLEK